jgi:hypothetical protein
MHSRGHGCKLARKCEDAVLALLAAPTVKAAARKVGVTEKTLRTWMRIPEFAALLHEARQQSFAHGLARLQAATGEAADLLRQTVTSHKGAPPLRLKAADLILAHSVRAAELTELRERLEALEAQLASHRAAGTGGPPVGVNGGYRP